MKASTLINYWFNAVKSEGKGKCQQVAEIGNKAGVHQNTIYRLLNIGNANVSTLVQLLEATGYSLQIVNIETGRTAEVEAAMRELLTPERNT
ncbi:MAG: hypothetical protein PHE17_19455 [Thiothrix sp.]|uniref:hypothetical protein n=1 Tax=Thiothrix sp. TaxID=1032 RepID=UPI00261CC96E|nr:hypothetical protein [Thiothrix sp.]MDD5395205.1 hypothetical protein [Thiothrix sp.]